MDFPDLTHGFLISQCKYQKLLLDPRIQKFDPKIPNILVIYSTGSSFTRITAYPVNNFDIWKVKIRLKACSPDIIDSIGIHFKEFKLIHTTGLCEKMKNLIIEDYFIPSVPKDRITLVLDDLGKSPGIEQVLFENIPLRKGFC